MFVEIFVQRLGHFWKRFARNRGAVIGFSVLIFLIILTIGPSYIAPFSPEEMNFDAIFSKPSSKHLFGTDNFGRDVLSRVVWGARVPVIVGFIAAVVSAVLGISVGAIAGYCGGRTDSLLMRVVDILLTIPVFFLVMVCVAFLGKHFLLIAAVIGITIWPSTARLIRAEFLSLKSRDFVEAAKVSGCTDLRLIFLEILPNGVHPAIVNSSLQIATAILMEASLSFLGLGDPNVISWGWMIHDALRSYRTAWWLAVFPGLAISISVISFNLIGDGFNDALNPKLKERY